MFNSTLSPMQVFIIIFNVINVASLITMTGIVWGYKKRVQRRYDDINKRLDNILLLTHEVYQSDRDKKQEVPNLNIIPGEVSPKETSGSELRTVHTFSV